jgi:predicted molibdopterin-dependent oxidoreductase YjgC
MNQSQPGTAVCNGLRERGSKRGSVVRFTFEGAEIEAFAGESIAAALLSAGYRTLRESPVKGSPRGAFCWMGICQECTVVVDGVRRPACRTECREGLSVRKGTIA